MRKKRFGTLGGEMEGAGDKSRQRNKRFLLSKVIVQIAWPQRKDATPPSVIVAALML